MATTKKSKSAPMIADPQRVADCLKVLGHATRLQILEILRGNERSVGELEELVGGSQPNISQHLRVMRDRQIVKSRKQANLVFYSVSDERLFELMEVAGEIFCRD